MYFLALLGEVEGFGLDEVAGGIAWALGVRGGEQDGPH